MLPYADVCYRGRQRKQRKEILPRVWPPPRQRLQGEEKEEEGWGVGVGGVTQKRVWEEE
jgi:hypothetical protein